MDRKGKEEWQKEKMCVGGRGKNRKRRGIWDGGGGRRIKKTEEEKSREMDRVGKKEKRVGNAVIRKGERG
jgi:hypothetical protein